jgi:hypothetical protein
MPVEAAWQAVRGPGPLRAFYERIARRHGNHIAAVVVARKLAVIAWHMLRGTKTMRGYARHCTPRNYAIWNCVQVSRSVAVSAVPRVATSELRHASIRGYVP